MKYHYIIVNKEDANDVLEDSRKFHQADNVSPFEGWDTDRTAMCVGVCTLADEQEAGLPNSEQYEVKVVPVSILENVSSASIEPEDAVDYNKSVYGHGDVNRIEAYRERSQKKGYYK
jgi:hypothetical protein